MDLIGPWTVHLEDGEYIQFRAITCIDPVINIMEAVRIRNKTSEHVAEQFANFWLAKYPKPLNCIYDNRGEFIGKSFRNLFDHAGIKKKPCTVKNPRSNAACERMHSTMGSILRAETSNIQDEDEAAQSIDKSRR